jgi:hypothetical protein
MPDPRAVRDSCEFPGYRESGFWTVVETFYNQALFVKSRLGEGVLKDPLWEQEP